MSTILYNYLVYYFERLTKYGECSVSIVKYITVLNTINGLLPYLKELTKDELDTIKNILFTISNNSLLPFYLSIQNEALLSQVFSNSTTIISNLTFLDSPNIPNDGIFGIDFTVSDGNVTGVVLVDEISGGTF